MSSYSGMPQRDKAICLIFGVLELGLTAFAWAVVSPFFGSLLEDLRPEERAKVVAFVIVGPLSALPAAVAMLWHRRLGAVWLIGGGLISGLMAVSWFLSDRGVLLAPRGPLPMVAVGLWQLLSPPVSVPEETGSGWRRAGSLILGVICFLVGWVGTYVFTSVLCMYNVTGLRGEAKNPWYTENEGLADSLVLLLVGTGVLMLTVFGRRKVRWEFFAGQWAAIVLAAFSILAS